MLVLSRSKNEVIRIGDDIRITVVEVRGNKVRIGVDAPRDVKVARDELAPAPAPEALDGVGALLGHLGNT